MNGTQLLNRISEGHTMNRLTPYTGNSLSKQKTGYLLTNLGLELNLLMDSAGSIKVS